MSGRAGHPDVKINAEYARAWYGGQAEIAQPAVDDEWAMHGDHPEHGVTLDTGHRPWQPGQPIVLRGPARQDVLFSSSRPVTIAAGTEGSFADVRYTDARPTVVYARVPSFDLAPILAVDPVPIVVGPPKGGVVAGCKVQYGVDGVQFESLFNFTVGNSLKVPVTATRVRASGLLLPKYYEANDSLPGIRTYNAPGTTQVLSPERFTNPLAADVLTLNPTVTGSIQLAGAVSEGSLSLDMPGRPTRRFFASFPAGLVPPTGQWVVCPVPSNVQNLVVLVDAFSVEVYVRPLVSSIAFPGYANVGAGGNFPRVGPFVPNVPLSTAIADGAVEVYLRLASGTPPYELPVEVVYYLST